MTVLAYKDGVLASDSRVASLGDGSSVIYTDNYQKVFKSKNGNVLFGFTGRTNDTLKVFDWAMDGANKSKIPKTEASGLVVYKGFEHPEVYQFDEGCVFPLGTKYAAEGSGMMIALGALYTGATPEEAVRAAIKFDPGCGGEVRSVRFD